ncbi:MAG: RnfABCDGE type electron transport complex subunit D [Candidatus Omnitrophica bacterium]|nr:RnfABCDGE type electron transport complex subunit D [Candidatus Omnitrophota bacterium]
MKFIVSHSPHIQKKETIQKIMWSVSFSLIPAGIAGILFFGYHALLIIFLGTFTAVFTEAFIQILTRQKITIKDGSAFLTGLLLAYNLPPSVPFWIPIVGSFFSIALGKQIFGGLGQNIVNPALLGRVFLLASWPKYMTTFVKPNFNLFNFFKFDAITAPTPLSLLKEAKPIGVTYLDLFLGNRGGCIGEVCIIALLLGALYLLIKKYIYLYIPLTYIGTVGIFTYIFGPSGFFKGDWLFHILSGGLILGAFFMATDYVTSPLTTKGQIIFGIGCGIITSVIRLWGGYPEGVSYAILIMNLSTPLIDRYTKSKIFGK